MQPQGWNFDASSLRVHVSHNVPIVWAGQHLLVADADSPLALVPPFGGRRRNILFQGREIGIL